MRAKEKVKMGYHLLTARFFARKVPLIVSWSLTVRCNYRCLYCDRSRMENHGETATKDIFSILDQLSSMGTMCVLFSGGEPLLRDDVGSIIEYASRKISFVSINTNGTFVSSKVKSLKHLNLLSLSIDGPQDINDLVRGRGSFQDIMNAIEISKKNKIKFSFATVLSEYNLECVDFLLGLAKKHKTLVTFQPVAHPIAKEEDSHSHIPAVNKYREIIRDLIYRKRKGEPVANSVSGLNYLYHWPDPKGIKCAGGIISCRIESNASMYPCGHLLRKVQGLDILEMGCREAFINLRKIECNVCWCARLVENNFLFSFVPEAVFNTIWLERRTS